VAGEQDGGALLDGGDFPVEPELMQLACRVAYELAPVHEFLHMMDAGWVECVGRVEHENPVAGRLVECIVSY
jgi:hypothetical protein